MTGMLRTVLAACLIGSLALPAAAQDNRLSARPIDEPRIAMETAERCLLTPTGFRIDRGQMTPDCAALFEPCLSRANIAGEAIDDPEVATAFAWLEQCFGRDFRRRTVLLLEAIERRKQLAPGGRPVAEIMAVTLIGMTRYCAREPDRLAEVQCQLDWMLAEVASGLDLARRSLE